MRRDRTGEPIDDELDEGPVETVATRRARWRAEEIAREIARARENLSTGAALFSKRWRDPWHHANEEARTRERELRAKHAATTAALLAGRAAAPGS